MNRYTSLLAKKSLLALLVLSFLLSACNLPRGTPTLSEMDLISTQAAQTVAAQLTQISAPPATAAPGTPAGPTYQAPTVAPPIQTGVPTYAPPSPVPSSTQPVASQAPSTCDAAKFVKDISVPDNTQFDPGTPFTKTWRLRNTGTCTWSAGYSIFFTSGDKMGAPDSVPIPAPVYPGNSVDVSVSMTSPGSAGTYRGDWKLRNASGGVFGIGDQNKSFWVQIQVVSAQAAGLDLLAQAKSAVWGSGVGNNTPVPLAYGGADNDPNGTVKIVDSVKLEDGQISGKVLLTYPYRQDNGFIAGLYPQYRVGSTDRLKGRLGFITNPDGSCGSGNALFQVGYLESGVLKILQEWNKNCNGRQQVIDIDLSGLSGKTVQFVLAVRANGPATDDWAIWNSLRVQP